MALVSAADYAASAGAKAEEQKAFAYQAANPTTSSYMPQTNDPGSAAYNPNTTTPVPGYNIQIGGKGMAYKDYKTANWNNMSQAQKDTWEKDGRNFSVLDDPDYLSKLNGAVAPLGAIPGEKVAQAPQTAISSSTMPQAYSSNMGIGTMEQAQFGMPQQTSTTTTPFKSAYDPAAAQKSASEQAAARIAQMQLGVQQGVDKYNTSRKNAFDYANQTTQGNRALNQFDMSQRGDQFGGSAREDNFRLQRQLGIEDTAANNNYQADLSASNQKLTDFLQAAPEQQNAMYQQVLQQLQSTANQQDQVALQARGQDMSQSNADRAYNYGASQDQIKNGLSQAQLALQQQGQAYNQNQTTNQNQFNNNLAANQQIQSAQNQSFNQQQQVKKEHTDLANTLSQVFNKYVYPTDDPMLSYAQVAGLPTATAQKLAQDAKNTDFDNAIKLALANSTITKTQADILNQAQQMTVSQQNANTTSFSAQNTAANQQFTQQLASAKQQLDQQAAGADKDAAIAKLLDSSPLLQKSFDSRGNPVGNKIAEADKPKMAQYIANLGLDAAEAKKWFLRYELWSDSGK